MQKHNNLQWFVLAIYKINFLPWKKLQKFLKNFAKYIYTRNNFGKIILFTRLDQKGSLPKSPQSLLVRRYAPQCRAVSIFGYAFFALSCVIKVSCKVIAARNVVLQTFRDWVEKDCLRDVFYVQKCR